MRSRGLVLLAGLLACAGRAPHAPPAPAAPVSPPVPDLASAHRALDSAIAAGAAPGAVLGVSWHGRHYYYGVGRFGIGNYTEPDSTTVYDLASLTKVVGLTTAAMLAVEEGRLALDAPIRRWVPEFAGPGKDAVTVRHLLTHTSGLPAWRPIYRETGSRAEAFALADTTPLDTVPGARYQYSDLGIMVLTQALERVHGERLDSLLARRVFQPLGMRDTRYLPPAEWHRRIPPTEDDPWRGRVLLGEVHDENAARLGGVSGHAGLFSTATDLLRFGDWLLAGLQGRAVAGGPPIAPATIQTFARRQEIVPGSSRALGWDTPSEGGSSGRRLSPGSIGHTGYTGTSIWIDPARDLVVVLLSNRVHPTRENPAWHPVRGLVADLVVSTLYPDTR